MPRTDTCTMCSGSGVKLISASGIEPCDVCGGNGYVPVAEPTIHDAIQSLHETEAGDPMDVEVEPLRQKLDAIDLANAKPVPGRMANQTWRILEEQRMAAEETIAECEAEIERWSDKMVDAIKAKRICEAGQAALEGEA